MKNKNLINEIKQLMIEVDNVEEVVAIQIRLSDILNSHLDDNITEDMVKEYDNKLELVIYTLLEKSQKAETKKIIKELIVKLEG